MSTHYAINSQVTACGDFVANVSVNNHRPTCSRCRHHAGLSDDEGGRGGEVYRY